jgi:hypothetical protein
MFDLPKILLDDPELAEEVKQQISIRTQIRLEMIAEESESIELAIKRIADCKK